MRNIERIFEDLKSLDCLCDVNWMNAFGKFNYSDLEVLSSGLFCTFENVIIYVNSKTF